MSEPSSSVDDLERLQQDAVGYFLRAANPDNGLIADSSREGSPCSIAATGLGLAAYVVGAERGFLPRRDAAARTLTALRFFRDSPQGEEPDATGHRGFYYHFLDMQTGRRVWECELSMIDTAILIAGILTSGTYFSAAADDEREIRELAGFLYERIDWPWAAAGGRVVRMGWKAGAGFLELRLGGIQRGDAALRPRPGLAHAPAARGELRGVDRDLSVGEPVRHRFPLRGAAVHPPTLARLDRLCAASRMRSCGRSGPTTSRTAAARPPSSSSTPCAIPCGSRGTVRTAGGSPPASAPAFRSSERRGASSGSSTATWRGEFLSDPMMGPWRPGRPWRPCPSHRRSSCRRSGTSATSILRRSARTGS